MEADLLPGKFFDSDAMKTKMEHVFFSVYCSMTGMRGLHIVVGLGLMVWMFIRLVRHEYDDQHYVALENASFFWHLVDLVWVFLFPLLYVF